MPRPFSEKGAAFNSQDGLENCVSWTDWVYSLSRLHGENFSEVTFTVLDDLDPSFASPTPCMTITTTTTTTTIPILPLPPPPPICSPFSSPPPRFISQPLPRLFSQHHSISTILTISLLHSTSPAFLRHPYSTITNSLLPRTPSPPKSSSSWLFPISFTSPCIGFLIDTLSSPPPYFLLDQLLQPTTPRLIVKGRKVGNGKGDVGRRVDKKHDDGEKYRKRKRRYRWNVRNEREIWSENERQTYRQTKRYSVKGKRWLGEHGCVWRGRLKW